MKSKLIAHRNVTRDYGLEGNEAIVDTDNGRILITDGFCGIDSPRGGAVRWDGGIVYSLKPDDTFDTLGGMWNDTTTHMQALLAGYDDDRPMLMWDGYVIETLASSLGL